MRVPVPMLPVGGAGATTAVVVVLLIGVAIFAARNAVNQPSPQPSRPYP